MCLKRLLRGHFIAQYLKINTSVLNFAYICTLLLLIEYCHFNIEVHFLCDENTKLELGNFFKFFLE